MNSDKLKQIFWNLLRKPNPKTKLLIKRYWEKKIFGKMFSKGKSPRVDQFQKIQLNWTLKKYRLRSLITASRRVVSLVQTTCSFRLRQIFQDRLNDQGFPVRMWTFIRWDAYYGNSSHTCWFHHCLLRIVAFRKKYCWKGKFSSKSFYMQ